MREYKRIVEKHIPNAIKEFKLYNHSDDVSKSELV